MEAYVSSTPFTGITDVQWGIIEKALSEVDMPEVWAFLTKASTLQEKSEVFVPNQKCCPSARQQLPTYS